MKEFVIAGGGASGMMAGIILGEKGYNVTIIEKNDRQRKVQSDQLLRCGRTVKKCSVKFQVFV